MTLSMDINKEIPNWMKREEFHACYRSIYGDRWNGIFEALLKPEKQVARLNLWTTKNFEHFPENIHSHQNLSPCEGSKFENLQSCFWIDSKFEIPRHPTGLLEYYIMDPASIIGARALQINQNDRVLDMCAAPGGKGLILCESLKHSGEIFLNELSSVRRARLTKVVQQYVPTEVRSSVWVKGLDGIKYGLKYKGEFNAILVDAPCTGERHLLMNQEEFEDWAPSRSKKYSQRQFGLLASAYLSLRSGGRMVYSTCSLNKMENDLVVEKLLDRHDDMRCITVNKDELIYGEQTDVGIQFLPDRCGFGPFYFSVLQKI